MRGRAFSQAARESHRCQTRASDPMQCRAVKARCELEYTPAGEWDLFLASATVKDASCSGFGPGVALTGTLCLSVPRGVQAEAAGDLALCSHSFQLPSKGGARRWRREQHRRGSRLRVTPLKGEPEGYLALASHGGAVTLTLKGHTGLYTAPAGQATLPGSRPVPIPRQYAVPTCVRRCQRGPRAAPPAATGICGAQTFALEVLDRGPQAIVDAVEVQSLMPL
ncbi:hypothetical protein BJV77DRAFT_968220 [Russula vinacea]|nr:hypothetical protein BJV77DRAFT_968220 [Russula vinacea]